MNAAKRRSRAKLKARLNRLERHFSEKGTDMPWMRVGNKDFGCPFRGKDRFGGMWRKAKDRIFKVDDGKYFCVPYQNNKYLPNGGMA